MATTDSSAERRRAAVARVAVPAPFSTRHSDAHVMEQATDSNNPKFDNEQVSHLSNEITRLKMLAHVFERWHQDMIHLSAQNRDMRGKGEDLVSIARELIMLSLNAAIEAARAGESARGFVVVAAEVRRLALRAQSLSTDLSKTLHKTELLTTGTFQDIQAGGKMMMAALSGLENMTRQLSDDGTDPDEQI